METTLAKFQRLLVAHHRLWVARGVTEEVLAVATLLDRWEDAGFHRERRAGATLN